MPTTYTKTIGPSGADFTTLTAWQTDRLGARGGDPALQAGDTEEAVLLDHNAHAEWAPSASWPGTITVRVRGQNSHNGDWTVGGGGAAFSGYQFASTINIVNTHASGLVLEFEDLVIPGHVSTSGRHAVYISQTNSITVRFKRCLVAGQSTASAAIRTQTATAMVYLNLENCVLHSSDAATEALYNTFVASAQHTITATGCTIKNVRFSNGAGQVSNPTWNGCLIGSFAGEGVGTLTATDSIRSSGTWASYTATNCSVATFVDGTPAAGQVGFADRTVRDYSLVDHADNLAIDYAVNATMPATDIVGETRDASPDAGAFEVQPAATTPPDAPTAPSATAVTVSSVRVEWTDTATNEASYEVGYRTLGSSGAWTLSSDAISANATQHTVTGLAEGSYEFRVRATNIIGSSAYATTTGATRTTKPGIPKGVGVNLDRVNYYTPEMPFNDIWLADGVWIDVDGASQSLGDATVDANGNLVSFTGVKARCFIRVTSTLSQEYVLLYDGSGTLSMGNATVTSSSAGRIQFTPNSAPSVWVDVTSVGTLTNFRCFRIEDEAIYSSQTFRTDFLNTWSQARCYRYLNWSRVGNVVTGSALWSDRPTLAYRGTKYREVALERIIAHSNATGKDCWINVPHIANDDFVENMAILFRDGITGSQKIYVEYSNECWNWSFTQTTYCKDQGVASSDPFVAAGSDDYQKGRYWYGMRTKQVMDIWATAFAGQTHRLVRVLAWQAAGDAVDPMAYPGIIDSLDAVAIAPYVGGAYGGTGAHGATPVADIINALTGYIDTELRPWVSNYVADWRDTYGLRIIGYEGGQHLYATGGDTAESDQFAATNRDAGIYQFVQDYMTAWHQESNDLLCWYKTTSAYSQYGYWGLRESDAQGRDDAYKMDSLLDYIEANTESSSTARRKGLCLRLGLGLR
jgi:hypothetical protein